ncbi:MAG: hypothetical protein ACO34D_08760, partial [Burkholderiaceae bacterium]
MKTNRFFGLLRHGLWLAAFAAGGAHAQSVAAHEALKALLGKLATQPAAAASGASPVAAATAPTMVPPAVAGSYRVRRGDTLDNIIRRVLPGVRPTRALRNAFVQA